MNEHSLQEMLIPRGCFLFIILITSNTKVTLVRACNNNNRLLGHTLFIFIATTQNKINACHHKYIIITIVTDAPR